LSESTTPVAAFIDEAGVHAPAFSDVLTYLQSGMQGIYGSDIYLGNDSQDGQMLGLLASAINDTNSAVVAAYNAFSPSTAQGAGLASVVKINGLTKQSSSNSTVDQTVVGQAGTTITNGFVTDENNNNWSLPATVEIPPSGTITVTATCQTAGAITAIAGTITKIGTPTRGWQSTTNAEAATVGIAVETDAALRVRQSNSTGLPAQTVMEALVAQLEQLPDVQQVMPFENDTNTTDSNGIPPFNISLVVEGGDVQTIAQTIFNEKTPGVPTFGNTSATVVDKFGRPNTVNFSVPVQLPFEVNLTLTPFTGFTTLIGQNIQAAIIAYAAANAIGANIPFTRLFIPALSAGTTYEITSMEVSINGGAFGANDIDLLFDQIAVCTAVNLTVT
jgi:uncharacterized phage protein gp47/JayE